MPSSKKKPIRCVLDETVLNADTVGNLTNMGLSIFADVCGKNRGVFVVADDDGTPLPATYSCLTLPPSFAKNAGIDTSEAPMATSNDIGACVLHTSLAPIALCRVLVCVRVCVCLFAVCASPSPSTA